ncbi:carbon-nitrogen hydrolase family protein [Nonomuraea typhae]|uniref:carbon-nitrogen hydrolase family protein n=1 Tax=Nonomuraea typhae TaxID=2603600 RepID=UPI0012F94DDE|nr:carbon-nitrogen hydrolase family protein [Nonomuraea typhae]
MTLIVAVAQISVEFGDVAANARTSAALIQEASESGAKLALFPELSLTGYDLALFDDPAAWVGRDDPRLDPARKAAQNTGVTAVVGAAYRHEDGTAWIASLALLPDGEIHVHGKRYLHGRERELFRPAGPGRLLEVDGWRVALAICYDAGVPAHAEDAARRGAEVYAGSVLYTLEETRRIDLHFGARAMDHRMYGVAANYAGSGPGWVSCGGSGAWHPDGTRMTQAPATPGLTTVSLSRAQVRAIRDKDAKAGYPRGA